MKRKVLKFLVAVGGLLASSVALAAEGAEGSVGGMSLWAIGGGLAMGLSALGGTLAQGKAAGSALEGITRNPTSRDSVFVPMLLALALIEFQAIMGFLIAYLMLSK